MRLFFKYLGLALEDFFTHIFLAFKYFFKNVFKAFWHPKKQQQPKSQSDDGYARPRFISPKHDNSTPFNPHKKRRHRGGKRHRGGRKHKRHNNPNSGE